jgi:hypothetical protein
MVTCMQVGVYLRVPQGITGRPYPRTARPFWVPTKPTSRKSKSLIAQSVAIRTATSVLGQVQINAHLARKISISQNSLPRSPMELVRQKSPEALSSMSSMSFHKICGLPIPKMFNQERERTAMIMNLTSFKMQLRRLTKWRPLLTRLR